MEITINRQIVIGGDVHIHVCVIGHERGCTLSYQNIPTQFHRYQNREIVEV